MVPKNTDTHADTRVISHVITVSTRQTQSDHLSKNFQETILIRTISINENNPRKIIFDDIDQLDTVSA